MDKDYVQHRNEHWMKAFPQIKFEFIFGRVLRISRYYQDQSRDIVSSHGLKPSEFDVLCSLYIVGEPYTLTPKEITSFAYRSPGAITNVLDNLLCKKFVERHENEKSRRSILITLTKSGQRIVEELLPKVVAMENELLSLLENEKKDALRSLLKEVLLDWEGKGKIDSPKICSN